MEIVLPVCGHDIIRYLLLTCVFLLKAAADCPYPKGGHTFVLTTEAILMSAFPEGTNVTLECIIGHVKERSSDIITCVHGKWSEPELICKRKDCGLPEPQPNMSFDVIAGTLFGDKIKVTCDKGFWIQGPGFQTCYDYGWSEKPRCETVTCDKPAEVINGRSSWDSKDEPVYGERIHYACNEGFTLVGEAVAECMETGEYDSEPPTCEEASVSTDVSVTPPAYSDDPTPTPLVSPSTQGGTEMTAGGGDATATTSGMLATSSSFEGDTEMTAGGRDAAATTSGMLATPSSFEAGTAAVAVVAVTCLTVALLYCRMLKKTGSYNIRKELKPTSLPLQNAEWASLSSFSNDVVSLC